MLNFLKFIKILKWHLKKTSRKFLSLDSRFEISTKKYIRNTFNLNMLFFSKFNKAMQQCAVSEKEKEEDSIHWFYECEFHVIIRSVHVK